MIDIRPLKVSTPDTRIGAVAGAFDSLNERYVKGASMNSAATKDFFGSYEAAANDAPLKNFIASKYTGRLDGLSKEYEGAYENRNFHTDIEGVVNEFKRDPLLSGMAQTKKEYDRAMTLREDAAKKKDKVLFDNIGGVRTDVSEDEEGNQVITPGQYTGELQRDWIGGAREFVGPVADDKETDTYLALLGGQQGQVGVVKETRAGVDQKKLNGVIDNVVRPFLEDPRGEQWMRYQISKLSEEDVQKLTDDEIIKQASAYLYSVSTNQLSDKDDYSWTYNKAFNEEQEPVAPAGQMFTMSTGYDAEGGGYDTDGETAFVGNAAGGVGGVLSRGLDNFATVAFDGKNEDYRKDVGALLNMGGNYTVDDFLETINGTEEEAMIALQDLGLDPSNFTTMVVTSSEEIPIPSWEQRGGGKTTQVKETKREVLTMPKTKEEFFKSKLGIALASKYREEHGKINKPLVVDPLPFSKNSEYENQEGIDKRGLSGKPLYSVDEKGVNIQSTKVADVFLENMGDDWYIKGTTSTLNISSDNPDLIGATVYERVVDGEKQQFIVGRANEAIPPRERNQGLAYSRTVKGNGREVSFPSSGYTTQLIKTQAQLDRSVRAYTEQALKDETLTWSQVNEMRKNLDSSFRNGKEMVLLRDAEGRILVDQASSIINKYF
jgi:hypothetical protein